MQALAHLSTDQMVIILPSALVVMYLVINLQKYLSERKSPYLGLILPMVCFIVATVLAVRPLIVADASTQDGLAIFCLRMWLTFNIPTIVFMFPYIRTRKIMKAYEAAAQQAEE